MPPLLKLALLPLLALQSPWWEQYELREQFICGDKARVVLERNDSQASLISRGYRSVLFREASDAPGLRYRNDDLRVILRGDELVLERLPQRRVCLRTEEV